MINVYAACDISSNFKDCTNVSPLPGAKFTSEQGLVGNLITEILPIILGVGGMLTVIFIIISGIQFITSSGNPEAANAAKGRLIYALIGFAVIVLAFAALQIISAIFLGDTGLV
ncbi:MAG: hypothetical protein Q8P25_00080 [Candidatus Curtissbacteria bacterium]|nr:hypothetical protein [Candidatus Curtissbacteria bacterium]